MLLLSLALRLRLRLLVLLRLGQRLCWPHLLLRQLLRLVLRKQLLMPPHAHAPARAHGLPPCRRRLPRLLLLQRRRVHDSMLPLLPGLLLLSAAVIGTGGC